MKPNKKIKLGIYLRVSTAEQSRKFGLDTQLRKIKAYIKYHEDDGWVFDEDLVYKDEGLSGTLPPEGRPALLRLMKDAKKGKFDFVLVYKLDRFFRSMRLLLETIENLQKLNIGFVSVSEKFDTSPLGRLLMNIFGTLAQFERDLIIERTSEGKISAAKAGRYVGGAIPLGYRVKPIKDSKNGKTIAPDKEEAQIVKDIFYWFVDLDHTPLEIARALTKRGVLTNKDKMHKGKYRKANPVGKWNETTIRRKLSDPHYIGKYYYNRRDGSGKLKAKEDWVEMECPRIINDETFNRAQKKLEKMKRGSNYKKYDYLFSSKIVCGDCHSKFTGCMSTKKTKNYRCLKTNKSKVVHPCKASGISEKILEANLFPIIQHFLKHPKEAIESLEKKLAANKQYNFYKEQKKTIDLQLNKIEQKRKILVDIRMNQQISKEEFNERLKLLKNDKELLEEELQSVESMLTTHQLKKEKISSVKEKLKKYKKKLDNPTYKDKLEIIQGIVKRVTIKGNDVRMELFIPRKQQKKAVKSKDMYGGTGGI